MKYLFVALICVISFGCGTRKTALDKSLESNKTSSRLDIKSDVKVELSKSTIETKALFNDKTDENSETTTTKKYGLDKFGNPYLQSETTTTKKGKSIDKGKANESKIAKADSTSKATTNIKSKEQANNKKTSKKKTADADNSIVTNVGGKGLVFVIVVVLVGALFCWLYLKGK